MKNQYVLLTPNQTIELRAQKDATPSQAINAAIEFLIENELRYVDLDYFGYLFGIEKDSDIKQMVADYAYWRELQKTKTKGANGE